MSSDDESFATVRIVAKKIDQNVTYYLMELEDDIEPGDSWFLAEDCPKVLIEEFEKGLKSTPPINNESVLDSVASRQLKDAGNREAEVSSSKPDETHPTDESSRTNHEEPRHVARKTVPYTTDELWSPDVSQDDFDPNDDSGSSSDCDTVDDLIAQKHPAKDLEIIGAAPLRNELGMKLWVKLKKSGKKLWFDSSKFGAAWPQVYIDYLERHKKLKPAPDEFSVKNLKKVSLG
ncbi:uncharacterized protein LOC135831865 [Planococcus citri]|uniref:uncharacterized protein LOC135831865 n=1 Tax=Planococcus citri TaxID=170843 RepID=UPI0031F7619C